jgi:peptidoglycan/LPS O-acetylase OafA/YrhL
VEEQFYAAWPLLLGGLFWATRRLRAGQWAAMRVVVGIATLVSVTVALRLAESDVQRAYYGTGTRAYQLLAGALLALTPELIARAGRLRRLTVWLAPVSLLAVVGIATSLLDVNAIQRGAAVVVATCVLLVALEGSEGGVTARLLSWTPIVYLGQRGRSRTARICGTGR